MASFPSRVVERSGMLVDRLSNGSVALHEIKRIRNHLSEVIGNHTRNVHHLNRKIKANLLQETLGSVCLNRNICKL